MTQRCERTRPARQRVLASPAASDHPQNSTITPGAVEALHDLAAESKPRGRQRPGEQQGTAKEPTAWNLVKRLLPEQAQHQVAPSMSDFDGLPVLISVRTAARILGISRASAYRYIDRGLLPVKRLGGRVYIVRDRLRDMVENSEGVSTG
jgi:excisionase family DNA binding protein